MQRGSHIVSSSSAFVKSVIISNFLSTFTIYDMAGRPTAPVEIVPPNTVIPLRNRYETFNLVELLPQLMDTDSYLQWLASRGLIRNTMACAACGRPCSLVSHGSSIDGRRWRCRPVTKGEFQSWQCEFFERTKAPLGWTALIVDVCEETTIGNTLSNSFNMSYCVTISRIINIPRNQPICNQYK